MHSDHRHPGSALNRATVADPRCTTLTSVLSGVRVSSGVSILLDSMLAMLPSPAVFEGTYDPLAANTHQGPIGVADASSTGRAAARRSQDASNQRLGSLAFNTP